MNVLTTKELKAVERKIKRKDALMPNNTPRYIRCYDNGGESADRYTVVFTGRYRRYKTIEDERTRPRYYVYLGMSANPFHPQGIGQHGESNYLIDRPGYSHLGKKISFTDLPVDCQKAVVSDYLEMWELN